MLSVLLGAALVVSTSLVRSGDGSGDGSGTQASTGVVTGEHEPAAPRRSPVPAAESEGDPRIDTVSGPVELYSVVSGPQGLGDAVVDAVDGLDDVFATTRVRSTVVGLFGSIAPDGTPRDVLPTGMRIPVNVLSIDPVTYLPVLPLAVDTVTAALVTGLQPGTVLLSTSSARLRGLGQGATVDLGRATGLVVAGVVDDVVARGSEFLVHREDAEVIVLGPREVLLVRSVVDGPETDATRAAREDAFDEVVAAVSDGDLQVWHATRGVPLVLSTLAVKERFGEFAFRLQPGQREVVIERRFIDESIVVERMPVLGNVRCHRLIMEDLRAAIEETVAAGFEEWLARDRYGGCFEARRIALSRENLSRHAWGIAIDLNVDFSLPGAGPVPPDAFIEIWGRNGFRWGGDFTSPDNHHFEWVGAIAGIRPTDDGT
jgi:hypothetical protein